jgi:hypothetical protein
VKVEDSEFAEFWAAYPKREGSNPKAQALKAWHARRREGVTPAAMLDGLRRYLVYVQSAGQVGSRYVMQAASFLGPEKRGWEELWAADTNGKSRDDVEQTVADILLMVGDHAGDLSYRPRAEALAMVEQAHPVHWRRSGRYMGHLKLGALAELAPNDRERALRLQLRQLNGVVGHG